MIMSLRQFVIAYTNFSLLEHNKQYTYMYM